MRENGEGSAELWAASRHKALRAKNLVSTRFFTLSDHAARKSGPEEKYTEAFSPMGSAELWAVSRHKALRVKNLVSTRFFTLSNHAGALQCAGRISSISRACKGNNKYRISGAQIMVTAQHLLPVHDHLCTPEFTNGKFFQCRLQFRQGL